MVQSKILVEIQFKILTPFFIDDGFEAGKQFDFFKFQ